MNRVFEAKVVSKSIISLENNSQFTKLHVFIHKHFVHKPHKLHDHEVVHEDFKFPGNEPNKYLLELKESLFIKRDRPSLNKNLYSQELLLF